MKVETIPDIVQFIRELPTKMEGFKHGELVVLDTTELADRIDDVLNTQKGEVVKSDSANKALAEIARITNAAKSDFDIFAGFERILKISNSALCEIRQ